MSEEEKKAIQELKEFAYNPNGWFSVGNAKTILNLIEKQQKELEKKDKIIKEKIEEYEEILKSPIIKDNYKKEVEHIIRVLEELKGDN